MSVGFFTPSAILTLHADGLENLEVMLHVIQGYGEELPPACQNTCQDAWSVFDTFLSKYSANYDLSERVTRVLRRGIDLFNNKSLLPVATSVLARMFFGFESTGYPSFLWIAGKIVGRFGHEDDSNFRNSVKELFERSTNKVASLLQVKTPGEIPDGELFHPYLNILIKGDFFPVLEDYIQMLLQFVSLAPDILFVSSGFPLAFRAAMTGLTVVHTDIIYAALDFFRVVLTHDCLEPQAVSSPKFSIYAKAIHDAVSANGLTLVACILNGLVGDFPEEAIPTIVSILRMFAYIWPTQLLAWLPQALEQLPPQSVPIQAKTQFLSEVSA